MTTKLQIFNNKEIRTAWNAEEEEWYFSVIDIVEILTDSTDYQTARNYWKVLKNRLSAEGSELVTSCNRLKMPAADGKMRMTDVLATKGVLRLVQSIPSPKAEPFKVWLAQVGSERLDEIAAPEKAIERGVSYYRQKGYSEPWINQRMRSIEVRNRLTDEWQQRGVTTSMEYAILTNDMTKAWSGKSVQEYKEFKGVKKGSLRDNMTDLELIFNMLAEATTTTLSKQEKPQGFEENRAIAKRGGEATKSARQSIEKEIGHSVISSRNATEKKKLITKRDEKSTDENE